MSEQVVRVAPERAVDANGDPVAGALAYFYIAGTVTLETVYTASDLATAHSQPLVADSGGFFAEIFHADDHGLKAVITDASGGVLSTVDPLPMTASTRAASNVTFSPITDNAATDVQAAVANNTAAHTVNAANLANQNEIVTTGGTGNSYTFSAEETITSYVRGQAFLVRFDRANTGAATVNIDGLGAKNLYRPNDAGAGSPLVADDLLANEVHRITYNGTQFILLDQKATETLRGEVEKATTAEAEAGTATDKFPDVAAVKAMIDAFSPIKAICYFDGTAGTPTPLGATNVTDITDNGAGDYTINFTTNMADTTYKVFVSFDGAGVRRYISYENKTVSSVDVICLDTAGSGVDLTDISIMVIE